MLNNGNRNVIHLNAATKAYVNTSIDDDEVQLRDFSIASFNAVGYPLHWPDFPDLPGLPGFPMIVL